jgi:hypothetical protein
VVGQARTWAVDQLQLQLTQRDEQEVGVERRFVVTGDVAGNNQSVAAVNRGHEAFDLARNQRLVAHPSDLVQAVKRD